MSIQNFFMRKMLANKMQGVPQAEQEKIFAVLEKNPELFQKMAMEIKAETDKGKDQMSVAQEVIKKYESDLKGLL